MSKLKTNIVKYYKWIKLFMLITTTILKTWILIELVKLGFLGIVQISTGGMKVVELEALYFATYTIFIIFFIIYNFIRRNDICMYLKTIVTVVVVEGIFISFALSLAVLGMLRKTPYNQIIFDYNNFNVFVISVALLFVLTQIDNQLWNIYLKKGE